MYIFVQKKELGRVSTIISEKDQQALKNEVEKVFGRTINQHSDCIVLSEWIKKQEEEIISPQTLRRFFGLIQSKSTPSLFTLNALSSCCGFEDWNDFIEKKKTHNNYQNNGNDSLLMAQSEIIESFFNIEATEWRDNNFFNSVRQISKRIFSNPSLADLLWDKLARNPTAQRWLFEYSPDMAGLAGTFRKGIVSYLRNKKTQEAMVYGYTLLFLGDYLSENFKSLNIHYRKLADLPLDSGIYCLPLARQLGTHLLYYRLQNNREEQRKWLLLSNGKYLTAFAHQLEHTFNFPGYHFMMADYLLLGNYYNEALEILEMHCPAMITVKSNHPSYDHVEIVYLMYAIANSFTGNEEKAKALMTKIQPEKICFIYQKYFMIRYLLLQLHLTGSSATLKKNKLKNEVQQLIAETGYTYFTHQLNQYF
ncbi:MAG: hypothetical protein HYR66_16575 [Sphingobacteriales bacterium]|nr:hypothetical protein [Sphingobacteriales bacterium]MBI3717895.1 hypothetical protein [Sphingobacteriales bacterium]